MIKLSKSCLSKKEKNAVLRVLDKEFLGMGPEVKKFENDLTRFLVEKHYVYQVARQLYN